MTIKEITSKSILRKSKKVDSWFISRYGMNLYRGCQHNCIYCDGRTEKYQVEGEFGTDISVKVNAIDILKKELDPQRKRKPFKKGFIILGGGVGDSYQPVEKKYKLCRQALQLIYKYNYPVHILTKSNLVKRDIDILKKINERKKAIISFSFSSVDDKISEIFEPGVPSPSQRLETISFFKKQGFTCGMFLMPVIPFITDSFERIYESIKKAKEIGVDFIIFSGMTLKEGKQKDYFINILKEKYPDKLVEYNHIYRKEPFGGIIPEYCKSIHQTFYNIIKKEKVPSRIPSKFFKDYIDENDLVIVILEHIDYLLKLRGLKSSIGYVAYSLSKLDKPLSDMKYDLRKIRGIGLQTQKIIFEILDTGTSKYYEKLLFN